MNQIFQQLYKLKWIRISCYLLPCLLLGCSTVIARAIEENAPPVGAPAVYSGVKLDAMVVAGAATTGDSGMILLSIPAIVDLPLSLVADTLLLPFDLARPDVSPSPTPSSTPRP